MTASASEAASKPAARLQRFATESVTWGQEGSCLPAAPPTAAAGDAAARAWGLKDAAAEQSIAVNAFETSGADRQKAALAEASDFHDAAATLGTPAESASSSEQRVHFQADDSNRNHRRLRPAATLPAHLAPAAQAREGAAAGPKAGGGPSGVEGSDGGSGCREERRQRRWRSEPSSARESSAGGSSVRESSERESSERERSAVNSSARAFFELPDEAAGRAAGREDGDGAGEEAPAAGQGRWVVDDGQQLLGDFQGEGCSRDGEGSCLASAGAGNICLASADAKSIVATPQATLRPAAGQLVTQRAAAAGDGTPVTPGVTDDAATGDVTTPITTPMLAAESAAVRRLSGAWREEASGAQERWMALLAQWEDASDSALSPQPAAVTFATAGAGADRGSNGEEGGREEAARSDEVQVSGESAQGADGGTDISDVTAGAAAAAADVDDVDADFPNLTAAAEAAVAAMAAPVTGMGEGSPAQPVIPGASHPRAGGDIMVGHRASGGMNESSTPSKGSGWLQGGWGAADLSPGAF